MSAEAAVSSGVFSTCPLEILEEIVARAEMDGVRLVGCLRQTCTAWRGVDFYVIARTRPECFVKQLMLWQPTAFTPSVLALLAELPTLELSKLANKAAAGDGRFFDAMAPALFPKIRAGDIHMGILLATASEQGSAAILRGLLASDPSLEEITGEKTDGGYPGINNAPLGKAAASGNVEFIGSVLERFPKNELAPACQESAYIATKSGKLAVLRLLHEKVGLRAEEGIVKAAAFSGNAEILEWLAVDLGARLLKKSARDCCLMSVVRSGSVAALRVLRIRYGVEATADALDTAVCFGHAAILTAFENEFGVTVADFPQFLLRGRSFKTRLGDFIFHAVCDRSAEVLRVLARSVGPEPVRYFNNHALRIAVLESNQDLLQVLVHDFRLTREDLQDSGAFYDACIHGDTPMICALVAEFKLTATDARGELENVHRELSRTWPPREDAIQSGELIAKLTALFAELFPGSF